MKLSKKSSLIAKSLIAAILLTWLTFHFDLGSALSLISQAQPALLIAALIPGIAQVIFDSHNSSLVMRVLGHGLSFRVALVYNIVGWFFSNFAPSTFGGDMFRAFQMSRVGVPVALAARCVLIVRLIAFLALNIVIIVGLPIINSYGPARGAEIALIGVLSVAIAGLVIVLSADRLLSIAPSLSSFIPTRFLGSLSRDFRHVLHSRQSPALIASAICVHLARAGIVYLLAKSLGSNITWIAVFAIIPAALLVAMIPVSLGSWGIREISFVYFLGIAGMPAEVALAVSLMFGAYRMMLGIPGAVVWLLAKPGSYEVVIGSQSSNHPN